MRCFLCGSFDDTRFRVRVPRLGREWDFCSQLCIDQLIDALNAPEPVTPRPKRPRKPRVAKEKRKEVAVGEDPRQLRLDWNTTIQRLYPCNG